MDAPENDELRTLLMSSARICREHYLRLKEAGDHVTPGEKAEARTAYHAALERLSQFLGEID